MNQHSVIFLIYGTFKNFQIRWHQAAPFTQNANLTCLHDQNKSGFFGGPAFI